MKKVIHSVLFIVIFLVVVLACVGLLSKHEHEGSVTQSFNASPETIWNILSDTEGYALSRHEVKKVELLPANETGYKMWREYTGVTGWILLEVTDEKPLQFIDVRMIESDFGMTGTWKFAFQPIDEKTTSVTITEKSVTDGFLMRTILSLVGRNGNLKLQMKAIEKNLGKHKNAHSAA